MLPHPVNAVRVLISMLRFALSILLDLLTAAHGTLLHSPRRGMMSENKGMSGHDTRVRPGQLAARLGPFAISPFRSLSGEKRILSVLHSTSRICEYAP